MVKENLVIEVLCMTDFKKNQSCRLSNCVIETIDLIGAYEFDTELLVENCFVSHLNIHSCWFTNGLTLRNSIIGNYVDYQMGGHNEKPFLIEGNIFHEFVNFFDCHFESVVEIRNNLFTKGSNLFGNKNEGFENTFTNGWVEKCNMGKINLDGVGL